MTDTATTLLAELTHRGVQLAAVGNRLRYRPREAVTAQLKSDLLRHKEGLLALLQHMVAPPLPAGTWGQCASALLARVADDAKRAALREAFEERAAICQHEGRLGVDEAERIAFLQLCSLVAGQAPLPSSCPQLKTAENGSP